MLEWQAGRLAGDAAQGALAGGAVQGAVWLSTQTSALRPVWFLFQMAVLGWGVVLPSWLARPQSMSLWALGGGMVHRFVDWCVTP